ncbi:twin-arginine translocase TatA/TatE family subunit [Olsenella profusa]|uniref:Twin-arginine translocase TatA/TatE family subunit n=1 Tax=Olsenella profusa TaxID=138595 RepID=A0ABS2F3L3_9ACTN|nr:twin-arginine translocase TatA/TatE family subunit [Olsenella profusa]
MFGIGETELVLIVLFAFMIFGPDKLPGMGRTLGRALRQFRNAQEGFTQVVQTEIVDPAAEAMSDSPKRPNRKRSVEFEEDADIDAPEGEDGEAARPKRTETFAERKKRLAEEKAARERAEKEAAAAEKNDEPADSDAPEGAPAEAGTEAAAPQGAPEKPAKPSLADLYAMTPATASTAAGTDEAEASSAIARAVSVGDSPVASHEVSEERSDERRADGGIPDGNGASATDVEKEA